MALHHENSKTRRKEKEIEQEHAERNAQLWDRRAETYDEQRFDYLRQMQMQLLGKLPLAPGQAVLDIGTGTGWAVRRMAAMLDQQGQFYGIDLAAGMLARAAAQSTAYPTAHFARANAEALPFRSGTFDLLICTNSFHHYLHPAQALAEMRRVLRPGGRLYLGDVTSDSLLGKTLDWRARRREPEHVRFYNTGEYQRLFAAAGLSYQPAPSGLWVFKIHVGEKEKEKDSTTL